MKSKSGLGSRPPSAPAPLSLREQFRGGRLVVIGGTGFLGKVWWVLMLDRFPELEQLYMVVRPRNGQSAEQRFFGDIAASDCLLPLRERHGDGFDAFLKSKITVLEGDIVRPWCGLSEQARNELRGGVRAVVNASGIVDFQPPLDIALEVNAFGMQSLVQLARDLGNVAVLHTSTCYVAGNRPGIVEELSPLDFPFPNAERLDPNLWDPDREIAECLDIIEQAKHRANDAFRESHFLDQAKRNLVEAGEPAKGRVLQDEIARVRRKFVEQQLAAFGQERAKFWGWPNTYTYTKSIGEQIIAKSGLPFTIVRPAIVESCMEFPLVGWNEGVNTSAPLIFAVREGQFQFPGAAIRLDIIPCDMVATGITLALGELLEGTQKPVYQFGTSDSNPTTMARIYELSGLYKRRHWQSTGRGGPVVGFLQAHLEGALMPTKRFERIGPRAVSKGAAFLADLLDRAPRGPVDDMIAPSRQTLRRVSKQQAKIADVVGQFAPFTADLDYEFRCDNTRAAHQRLSPEERARLYWTPEAIDWRDWFLSVHVPGLERWVFPELEKRLQRPLRPLKRHATLTQLLEEMAERHELSVALQRIEPDGLSRISFREWYERSLSCAGRLQQLGVSPGQRVVLCANNHPDWPIAFFGILFAGATAVPLAKDLGRDAAQAALFEANPRAVILDPATRIGLAGLLGTRPLLLLSDAAESGPLGAPTEPQEGDIAVMAYTSGRHGAPKAVLLSHHNLTSLIAQLAPLFPLSKDDRMLSVLPLHQLYELTAGLLLPLSRGARVVYLDEDENQKIESALQQGLVTSVVAVPEVWQRLQAEVVSRIGRHGPLAMRAFDLGLELNRLLGTTLGVDAGRLLFGPVHGALGGRLRTLVSGGAALDPRTHEWFAGLGLHLAEGYGLTEASPLVSVSSAGPRTRPGQVGRAIPGVEVRIDQEDEAGVGEILVRGPNVMVGYLGEGATRSAVSDDGWLHTGDRGRVDHKGRLSVIDPNTNSTPEKPPGADTRPASKLPPLLGGLRKSRWFGAAEVSFYSNLMHTRVIGRAFVPESPRALCVANHRSTLDEGLVRFALGSWAKRLQVVAVGSDGAAQRALDALADGHPVLLFPEGPPSRGPTPGDFDALVGRIALECGAPVLPLWLGGTFEALPHGALLPRSRELIVRIGPLLSNEALQAHIRGFTSDEAHQRIALFARHAVSELGQGRAFELPELPSPAVDDRNSPSGGPTPADSLSTEESALGPIFDELLARFERGSVKKPISYYFSIGDDKYTLKLSGQSCVLERGLTVERADCVVKTTPELFRRMILEGYTPGAREVMTGALKSNNPKALKDLRRIFALESRGSKAKKKRPPKKTSPEGAA